MRAKQYSERKIRDLPQSINSRQLALRLDITAACVCLWISRDGLPAVRNNANPDLPTMIIFRDDLLRWMKNTNRLKP